MVYLKAFNDGLTPPNPEELLDLVCRKGLKTVKGKSKTVAKARKWFAWYVDDLLSKAAGKDHWSTAIRCYEGPSSAIIPETKPPQKFIPSSTEAFVVFAVENAYARWTFELEMKTKGEAIDKTNDAHVKKMATKYSDCSSGQQRFGGWSAVGRKRFEAITKIISEARAKPRGKDAEKQCLLDLKKKHKLVEKGGKKKKKKAVALDGDVCDGAIAWGVESDADDATIGEDSDVMEEGDESEPEDSDVEAEQDKENNGEE
jgi:hypothetical protein